MYLISIAYVMAVVKLIVPLVKTARLKSDTEFSAYWLQYFPILILSSSLIPACSAKSAQESSAEITRYAQCVTVVFGKPKIFPKPQASRGFGGYGWLYLITSMLVIAAGPVLYCSKSVVTMRRNHLKGYVLR